MFARIIPSLLAGTALLISACQPAPPPEVNPSPTPPPSATPPPPPTPTETQSPTPQATRDPREIAEKCERPYSPASIWNQPIDWEIAQIHEKSDEMMAAFFKTDKWIGSNVYKYAPNIYFVTEQTPLVRVMLWDGRSFRDATDDIHIEFGEQGGTVYVPIPVEAEPAPGTDGELVVINLDTGEEWGIINGYKEEDGSWYVGGLYRYHVWNSGTPPQGFAQRGAGVGAFAGIVRPCEVERGEIGHAVTLAYDYPCAPEVCQTNGWLPVIPPFTKTDGIGKWQYDIPEGARIAIRPEISPEEMEQACRGSQGCLAWIKNMQEYGGYVVDNSGHPKTFGEGDATAQWDSSVWQDDMLEYIPPTWYVVLDWNVPAALP